MGLEPGVLLDVSEHPLHKIALVVDVTVVRSRQFGNRDPASDETTRVRKFRAVE